MPTVRVNGVGVHYETKGEGAPVLFIHGGFGGAVSTLVPQPRAIMEILPEQVRTIAYDRRCCGQSEYVLDPYDLTDLAADARALLDHLGVERSIIIGDSMGGMVALQYAVSFPETVVALGLLETGAALMTQTGWGEQMRAEVDWANREGAAAVFAMRREGLRNPAEPPAIASFPQDLAERARAQRAEYLAAVASLSDDDLFVYFAGLLRNEAAFTGFDFAEDLGDLSMPVCIIHGRADTVVPPQCAEELRKGIENAEFHAIEGGRHGILAYPAAAEALRGWVLRMAALPG